MPSLPPTLHRPRRLRQAAWIREMLQETRLHVSDLILPIFITEGRNLATPIASMPGVSRLSIDLLVARAKEVFALGIPAIALFPQIDDRKKTADGSEALNPDNLVCRAIKAVKEAVPELGIITDVALDPYTTHGHDGVLNITGDLSAEALAKADVANDATVEILCQQALVQAAAGCDIVAPSDMMDGRVRAIRHTLETNGHPNTIILSYAAKYASSMYGPFRDAVGSNKSIYLDKRTYQMNAGNAQESLREIALDVAEGADMVMVKPGIAYLDIITRATETFDLPVLAYQVSGEYAMIHAAAANGWIDGNAVMLEQLLAFKRAGASAIFTYAAMDVAKSL